VKSGALSAADRLGLIEDAFALALSGTSKLVDALVLAESYINETDYVVWSTISDNLGTVSALLSSASAEVLAAYDRFVLRLYSKIGALGWDSTQGESDLNKLLRPRVLAMLGGHGDHTVIEEAKKRYATFSNDFKSLSADIAGVVFKLTVKSGDDATLNSFIEVYEKLHKSSDQIAPEMLLKALSAIGAGKSEAMIQKSLDYCFNSECVRSQDMYFLILSTSQSQAGRAITWKYLKDNWDNLMGKLEGGGFLLGRVITFATSGFCTKEDLDDIETFFAEHKVVGLDRTVAQAVESIKANIASLELNKDTVSEWLKANYIA